MKFFNKTPHEEDFIPVDFGDLKAGDVILDADGEVTVSRAYDEHIPERMYRIELKDGSVIKASGNHLWYIEPTMDIQGHRGRLLEAKRVLAGHTDWFDDAEEVAYEPEKKYEIAMEDLMNFFDFIEDESARYFFLKRIADSIGHISEETITQQDVITGETVVNPMTMIYDARCFMQQALSLTGLPEYSKEWPVIVGRVVTTDEIFEKYPDADIPSLSPKRKSWVGK